MIDLFPYRYRYRERYGTFPMFASFFFTQIQLHSSFAIILLPCSCVKLEKLMYPLLFKIVCHVKVVTITNLLGGIV